MTTLIDDDFCFACGEKNFSGLQMRFEPDEEAGTARASAYLDERFQGWQGVAHGGIVATLIDDAMAYAGVEAFGAPGVIGRLNVRFRKPVPLGAVAVVRAWVTRRRRNVLKLEAQVLNTGGLLLVTAEGMFVGKERIDDE
jgi:acyl-coenzyme A thioesterase PaaI-like protein